jgi:hypothetical protein
MTEAVVRLLIGLGAFTVLLSLLGTAGIKLFARPLTLGQAFIISIFSFTISNVLIAVYFLVQAASGIPRSVDSVVIMILFALTGVLITRRARAYGVEKTGWLGVGGKTILAIVAFSWVLVGLYVLVTFLAKT